MLSIIIGIVFIMLLFSLLATTIMELIAGFLTLRGKHLLAAIGDMLGDWTTKFQEHPYFRQLSSSSDPGSKRPTLPSYISAGTFSAILTDLISQNQGANLAANIDKLPDSRFKSILEFLYKEAGGELHDFKLKAEAWFNESMDRASGAYKSKTKNWLLGVGFCLAVLFNVDPLDIYSNLSVNATLRDYLANSASAYVQHPTVAPDTAAIVQPVFSTAKLKLDTLLNNNIAAISAPLGLGWSNADASTENPKWWLYKVIGWITTALAISLGATFWFDLLKQLVSLRSSGPPPTPSSGLSNQNNG